MRKPWPTKKLGEVCEIIMGQSPDGESYNTTGEGVPLINGPVEFSEGPFGKTVRSKFTTQPTKFCRANDLILCVRGSTTGKTNIADFEACIGRGVAAIRAREFQPWINYFVISQRDEIHGTGTGATFPNVSGQMVSEFKLVMPPPAEQRRIVGILDETFAGIAAAKAHAEQNRQNTRALFESQLHAVFTQRGPGWVADKLQKLTTKIGSGATPRGGGESYKTEGISLIRSLNVHDLEFRYPKLAFLDDAQAADLSNVEVRSHDVLLNITGASVARCCIVPNDVLPARVNQHVSIIRSIPGKLSPEFLHYLLISKPYKDRLLRTGEEGGSTRQAITKAQIQNFEISHPRTLKDQRDIVEKLDALSAETQRLESLYLRKLAALDELKAALLHQAFSGQL